MAGIWLCSVGRVQHQYSNWRGTWRWSEQGQASQERGATCISQVAEVCRTKIRVPRTACRYCKPCPAGVSIPQNSALPNDYSGNDQSLRRWLTRREYGRLASSKQKLNPDVPNGSAVMCVKCGICLEECPQRINIPTELGKVQAIPGERRTIRDCYPSSGS